MLWIVWYTSMEVLCASWIYYMNYGSCYILYRIVDRGINRQCLICKMNYTYLFFELCLDELHSFVFWDMFGFYFILENGLASSAQAKVLALGASCASWVLGMIDHSIRLVECSFIRGRWLWFHLRDICMLFLPCDTWMYMNVAILFTLVVTYIDKWCIH